LYRLAVFPIDMPPLRSRGGDVELLAEHFLTELNAQSRTQKRLSAMARMTLKQHTWPGNVRELKNCIERAFILGDQTLELAPLIQNAARSGDTASDRERLDIRVGSRIYDVERSLIEATLDYTGGGQWTIAGGAGAFGQSPALVQPNGNFQARYLRVPDLGRCFMAGLTREVNAAESRLSPGSSFCLRRQR